MMIFTRGVFLQEQPIRGDMLNISLRTRLTFLIIIALLPVFGLVTYISIRDQQQTIVRAGENLGRKISAEGFAEEMFAAAFEQ